MTEMEKLFAKWSKELRDACICCGQVSRVIRLGFDVSTILRVPQIIGEKACNFVEIWVIFRLKDEDREAKALNNTHIWKHIILTIFLYYNAQHI